MTDLPYTDADLRTEAARQLATLADDPDTVTVSERMADSIVQSTDAASRKTWNQLLVAPAPDDEYEDFDTARETVHELISGAADVSEWAISLGAAGLAPTGHRIEIAGPDGGVAVRLHFAFDPDMPAPIRDSVVADLVAAISPVVPLLPQT